MVSDNSVMAGIRVIILIGLPFDKHSSTANEIMPTGGWPFYTDAGQAESKRIMGTLKLI